jgi:hypothetical protein
MRLEKYLINWQGDMMNSPVCLDIVDIGNNHIHSDNNLSCNIRKYSFLHPIDIQAGMAMY